MLADEYCPSAHKKRHETQAKAKTAARRIRKIRTGYQGQVYLCAHCEGWHVGTHKPVTRGTQLRRIDLDAQVLVTQREQFFNGIHGTPNMNTIQWAWIDAMLGKAFLAGVDAAVEAINHEARKPPHRDKAS